MIQVKLPDGSVKEFPTGTRSRYVAAAIGPRLAKDAVAREHVDSDSINTACRRIVRRAIGDTSALPQHFHPVLRRVYAARGNPYSSAKI